ncbi:MAG: WbqC family protein [Bacteroidales bacterium]|nr:WbqC family protein [Bacteroidales bacterium]
MLLSTAFFPPLCWFAAAAEDWGRVVASNPSSVCDVYLEACENFCKQSYRNRCIIAAAGGPEAISVPVVHDGDVYHTRITEVRVDYSDSWVVKAERAIDSAYRTSAFFEYYRDDVFSILDSRIPTLWDLNLAIINYFIRKIRLGIRIVPTADFIAPAEKASEPVRTSCSSHHRLAPMVPPFTRPRSPRKSWISGVTRAATPPEGSSLTGKDYEKDYRYIIHPKKENTILKDMNLEKPYFQVFAGKYGFLSDLSVMDLLFNEGPDSILYIVPALR